MVEVAMSWLLCRRPLPGSHVVSKEQCASLPTPSIINFCSFWAKMQMARGHCLLLSRCPLGGQFLEDCLENVEVKSIPSIRFSLNNCLA